MARGPADGTIRQVSAEEAEKAFSDEAGAAVREPGATKQPGGRGSVAGIRTGSKEAGGGIDAKAVLNKLEREQKRAALKAAAKAGQPATAARPNRTPVQQAPVPAGDGLEEWERQAPVAPPAPRPAAPARQPVVQGDLLNQARLNALRVLDALPDGMELFVSGQGLNPEGVNLVMGLGLLIGLGYAAYRGDSHYRITAEGRTAASEELDP